MKKRTLRIIDANINRATEGIRVIEDVLRFIYNDEKIYKNLRKIRHKIAKIFKNLYSESIIQRDSNIDPGKKVIEKKYYKINEILISNFHRVTESLRVLEEIAKYLQLKKVLKIKILRYKLYDFEKLVFKKYLK